MRIPITSFQVTERYILRDPSFFRWLLGKHDPDEFHFDCLIYINREDTIKLRGVEERKDFIELPNKVRLQVWQVEPGKIRAKTYKFIKEDLQRYKPTDLFLVYDRRHGHIRDF